MQDTFDKINEALKLFDSYSRIARLYPALLTSAPLLWTVAAFYPEVISGNLSNIVITAFIYFGGLVLLGNLARYFGKKSEIELIELWGGLVTTTMLRHRDSTIDRYTKKRYHSALQTICGDTLELPTVEDEIHDPATADEKYRSSIKALIERRRDKKYHLLHKELASYGFRRNFFGLKPIAAVITIGAVVINSAVWFYTLPNLFNTIDIALLHVASEKAIYVLFLADFAYLAILFGAINSDFVKQSATEYAIALLRTLDEK